MDVGVPLSLPVPESEAVGDALGVVTWLTDCVRVGVRLWVAVREPECVSLDVPDGEGVAVALRVSVAVLLGVRVTVSLAL